MPSFSESGIIKKEIQMETTVLLFLQCVRIILHSSKRGVLYAFSFWVETNVWELYNGCYFCLSAFRHCFVKDVRKITSKNLWFLHSLSHECRCQEPRNAFSKNKGQSAIHYNMNNSVIICAARRQTGLKQKPRLNKIACLFWLVLIKDKEGCHTVNRFRIHNHQRNQINF